MSEMYDPAFPTCDDEEDDDSGLYGGMSDLPVINGILGVKHLTVEEAFKISNSMTDDRKHQGDVPGHSPLTNGGPDYFVVPTPETVFPKETCASSITPFGISLESQEPTEKYFANSSEPTTFSNACLNHETVNRENSNVIVSATKCDNKAKLSHPPVYSSQIVFPAVEAVELSEIALPPPVERSRVSTLPVDLSEIELPPIEELPVSQRPKIERLNETEAALQAHLPVIELLSSNKLLVESPQTAAPPTDDIKLSLPVNKPSQMKLPLVEASQLPSIVGKTENRFSPSERVSEFQICVKKENISEAVVERIFPNEAVAATLVAANVTDAQSENSLTCIPKSYKCVLDFEGKTKDVKNFNSHSEPNLEQLVTSSSSSSCGVSCPSESDFKSDVQSELERKTTQMEVETLVECLKNGLSDESQTSNTSSCISQRDNTDESKLKFNEEISKVNEINKGSGKKYKKGRISTPEESSPSFQALEDQPVRRSSRIRSLEEKKEKELEVKTTSKSKKVKKTLKDDRKSSSDESSSKSTKQIDDENFKNSPKKLNSESNPKAAADSTVEVSQGENNVAETGKSKSFQSRSPSAKTESSIIETIASVIKGAEILQDNQSNLESSDTQMLPPNSLDGKKNDDDLKLPQKLKSRWRRNSELF